MLARDAPAEKPEPPLQGSGLRERLDAGEDETWMPPRYPCIPPSSVEKPWPALKRDGQLFPNPFQPFLRPQQQWHDPRVTVTLTKPMGMTLDARPHGTGAFVSKLVEGSLSFSLSFSLFLSLPLSLGSNDTPERPAFSCFANVVGSPHMCKPLLFSP